MYNLFTISINSIFFKYMHLSIYFWLHYVLFALRAFLWLQEQGLVFAVVWASRCGGFSLRGLLIAGASLVAKHRLWGAWASAVVAPGPGVSAPRLQSTGSVVVAHELSCSLAPGIFPDQGSNPRLLHWLVLLLLSRFSRVRLCAAP